MSIRVTEMEDPKAVVNEAKSYPFALVYQISSVFLGKTADLGELSWDEMTEARFFSDTQELRYFVREGVPEAVLISEDGACEYVDEKRRLGARFSGAGKSVIVRKYINYDEDGQAFVEACRLVGLEGV